MEASAVRRNQEVFKSAERIQVERPLAPRVTATLGGNEPILEQQTAHQPGAHPVRPRHQQVNRATF